MSWSFPILTRVMDAVRGGEGMYADDDLTIESNEELEAKREEELFSVVDISETEIETAHPAAQCTSGIFLLTWESKKEDPPQTSNILLWDALEKTLLWSVKSSNHGADVIYRPVANKIIRCSGRGSCPIQVWDLTSGYTRTFQLKGDALYQLCLPNNNGTKMLTRRHLNGRYSAHVWSLETGIPLFSLGCRLHPALFSADDSKIVAFTEDAEMCAWNAETGEKILTFQEPLCIPFSTLTFSEKGNLCCVYGSSQLGVWDVDSGRRVFFRCADSDFQTACFGTNDESIVVAFTDYDIHTPDWLECWCLADGSTVFGTTSSLVFAECIVVSSTTAALYYGSGEDVTFIHELDMATGRAKSRKVQYKSDRSAIFGSRDQTILL
jgi:WD40 repeat protein